MYVCVFVLDPTLPSLKVWLFTHKDALTLRVIKIAVWAHSQLRVGRTGPTPKRVRVPVALYRNLVIPEVP